MYISATELAFRLRYTSQLLFKNKPIDYETFSNRYSWHTKKLSTVYYNIAVYQNNVY